MKKTALFLLIVLFSLHGLYAHADTVQTADTGAERFESTWSTDGATADIRFEDDYFQVHVERFDHGEEWNTWDYRCTYDAAQQALIADGTGCKTAYAFDFATGCETETMVYQNGSAVFSLHPEEYLVWLDEEENAGQELRFTKMGPFNGVWCCGPWTIEFTPTGNAYRCRITRNDENGIAAIWSYFCRYDAVSQTVISDHTGQKEIRIGSDEEGEIYEEVYANGSAVFSMDNDGNLLWQDRKDDAGKGMLFIPWNVPEK